MSEEAFVISKIKNTVPWTYVICDLNGEEFRIGKVFKRKGDKLYVKWKGMIIHLIVGLIKKI